MDKCKKIIKTKKTYGGVQVAKSVSPSSPSDSQMHHAQGATKTAGIGRNSIRSKIGHGLINETVADSIEDIQEYKEKDVQSEEQDVEGLDDRVISEGLIRNVAEKGDVPGGGGTANNVLGR